MTPQQLAAWSDFGPEWDGVKQAWLGRGYYLPPSGSIDNPRSQRAILWQIVDARPHDAAAWIREAKGKTSHEIVANVLARWRALEAWI